MAQREPNFPLAEINNMSDSPSVALNDIRSLTRSIYYTLCMDNLSVSATLTFKQQRGDELVCDFFKDILNLKGRTKQVVFVRKSLKWTLEPLGFLYSEMEIIYTQQWFFGGWFASILRSSFVAVFLLCHFLKKKTQWRHTRNTHTHSCNYREARQPLARGPNNPAALEAARQPHLEIQVFFCYSLSRKKNRFNTWRRSKRHSCIYIYSDVIVYNNMAQSGDHRA